MSTTDTWELVYTPRWLRLAAIWTVILIMAIHLTFGLLLDVSYTGVGIGWADKIGLIAVGAVISGAVLLVFRARLRVGPDGVAVRNLVSERLFDWDVVRGLEYPAKGFSAQLLLPDDEHIPVLAVQARDGDAAVAAMTEFRSLHAKHSASVGPAEG
ncbi:PH domain-containing protein [Gordonia zhaorongruii]|uniref:PH domain-containing protein n=1 Tax=Gordonia zhaorongruii TaxID=2597659 RepID=UPI001F27481C|nr:PH domain-containing protein [Gordonia zhaorongruii]